jgi:hypothetical protein
MPFDARGKHFRDPCPNSPTGGTHSYGKAFQGRGCRITWCTRCRKIIKWHPTHNPPNMDLVREDLANFEEKLPELIEAMWE